MNKKLSIELPPELHKRLKQRAADEETTIRAILIEAIKRELSLPRETGGESEPREG